MSTQFTNIHGFKRLSLHLIQVYQEQNLQILSEPAGRTLQAQRRDAWIAILAAGLQPLIDDLGNCYIYLDGSWSMIDPNRIEEEWKPVPDIMHVLEEMESRLSKLYVFRLYTNQGLSHASQQNFRVVYAAWVSMGKDLNAIGCKELGVLANVEEAEQANFQISENLIHLEEPTSRMIVMWRLADASPNVITLISKRGDLYRCINGRWYWVVPRYNFNNPTQDVNIAEVMDIRALVRAENGSASNE